MSGFGVWSSSVGSRVWYGSMRAAGVFVEGRWRERESSEKESRKGKRVPMIDKNG